MSWKPKFSLYQIKCDSDDNIFDHLMEKMANIRKKYKENYFFEKDYDIGFLDSKLIKNIEKTQDETFTVEKFRELVEEENIRIKITDSGKVILICNLNCDNDTQIDVWGTIFEKDLPPVTFK